MRDNPLAGAMYLLRGLGLCTRPGLRRYVAMPLAVNVLLFTAVIVLGADQVAGLVDRWLPDYLEFLKWIVVPLFVLTLLVVGFFAFNLVANLVAAPFNGLLAEAVEHHLTGEPLPPATWRRLLRDLGRTVGSELRKLVYVLVRMLPVLVLVVIPLTSPIGSIAWLVLSAWMLAVGFADYPMANHEMAFPEQRRRLAGKRWLSLGFGAAVMLCLSVPLLNFVVIPAAVAGATAMWVERLRNAPGDGS